MSKPNSGLFSGTKGDKIEKKLIHKEKKEKLYQGERSRKEYSDLARDPARGTKVDKKGQKERAIVLDLEKQGIIGKVIRDPQKDKGADFIDTTNKNKLDIKSFVSKPKGHNSPRKGAFEVKRAIANINKEINRGNKVIVDTRRLNKNDRKALKEAIKSYNLENYIIWYDKKGQ